MSKIRTCLWFDYGKADEAMAFYGSIFPDFEVLRSMKYGPDTPDHEGETLWVEFNLLGRTFQILAAGPMFPLTEAVSLFVECEDQAETDRYWDALLADGGEPNQCGWLRDKFGLSWQIVPREFMSLVTDSDEAKAGRVMQAMMEMVKIDLEAARRAADGA
jgi:predicted 3-demethylubiquinone-9 3-methyltransferase (glyoxalase superfamily)